MNLRTIPELARRFEVPVGLSDHTMDIEAPVAAVALGACIIEKHLTLSRAQKRDRTATFPWQKQAEIQGPGGSCTRNRVGTG